MCVLKNFFQDISFYSATFKEVKQRSKTMSETCCKWKISEGKAVLHHLLLSQEQSTLFPEERLECDWVPFRPTISNISKVLDSFSLVLYSHNEPNKQLLTIGNCYKVSRGVKCTISLYGDLSSESLPGHLGKYVERCLELAKQENMQESVNCTFLIIGSDCKNNETLFQAMNQFGLLLQQNSLFTFMCCIEDNL